ncbi:MAG TPA: hypothetical protein VF691_20975 [Cytophagaceae bacterium]|jgi:hypothetical protein
MRQFIIEGKVVNESSIERYYHLGDECHHKLGSQLHRYEGELFISQSGKIVDLEQAEKYVSPEIFCDGGDAVTHHKDFFGLDAMEGFVYYNKLCFVDGLEEFYE